jgi:hypothetical protein
MLKWFIRRRLTVAEEQLDTDFAYLKQILATSSRAFRKFFGVLALARYNEDAPKEAWHAAKIIATLAEDCGPCAQLVVTMAERDGIPIAVLQGIVENDQGKMGNAALLGAEFARAVLAHDTKADYLREQIRAMWGERAVVSLALAIAASRMFPTVKYAMGYGQPCHRLYLNKLAIQIPRNASAIGATA